MEMMNIFENLEVAIITKSELGLGFCNLLGYQIIRNILTHTLPENDKDTGMLNAKRNLNKSS